MDISTDMSVSHMAGPSPAISSSSLHLNIVGGTYEVWSSDSHVKSKRFAEKKKNDPDT